MREVIAHKLSLVGNHTRAILAVMHEYSYSINAQKCVTAY